jgi:hypothetical protein
MNSILATLFYGVILILIPTGILYLFLVARLMSRLRDAHRDVYAQLGEPTLFLNNTPAKSMRLVGFILRGQYLKLADKSLNALGRACRILLVITFAGFAFCSIVVAFYWTVLE